MAYLIKGFMVDGLNGVVQELVFPGVDGQVRLSAPAFGPALEVGMVRGSGLPDGVGILLLPKRAPESLLQVRHLEAADGRGRHAVLAGREGGVNGALRLQVVHGLDFVVVEGVLPREGAVQSGFEEGGPVVFLNEDPALIVLADPGHPGVDGLAAVGELDGRFPEQEVHEGLGLEAAHKVGVVEPLRVVLVGPEGPLKLGPGHSVDGGVVAGEVRGAGSVVVSLLRHAGRVVGDGRVGALAPSVHPLGDLS